MNIGLMSWKVFPTSSQIVRNRITEMVPRIFAS